MLSFCNEVLRAVTAATTSEGVEIAEETAKRADICDAETGSHLRLHLLEDGGSRHPLTFLVAGGRSEILMEELFLGRLEAELQIRLHHQPRLLLVEIAGLTLSEQLLSLGIELVVVDAMPDIDGACQLDTDEATYVVLLFMLKITKKLPHLTIFVGIQGNI